ncbi:hypothetical protein OH807_00645 [Kitasatospora sp. NBC_01560]|uniref:hypothetical protein n=1 Tax=Kitasatospora sp. NBC_01560 TaxID=2975965 RepID=UPI00386AD0CC
MKTIDAVRPWQSTGEREVAGGGPVAGLLTAVGESPLTEVGSGAGGGLAHRADLLADHGDVLLSFDTFNPFETLSHQ